MPSPEEGMPGTTKSSRQTQGAQENVSTGLKSDGTAQVKINDMLTLNHVGMLLNWNRNWTV
jgi:hypothetical protein